MAPDDQKHFKVFRHAKDLQAEGYESVAGTPIVFFSWWDYVKLSLKPPDPNQIPTEQWFRNLDELDEVTRAWNRHDHGLGDPEQKDRDSVRSITCKWQRKCWAKPISEKTDLAANTHRAIVAFLRSLFTNRRAQNRLGFQGRNANWQRLILAAASLAEEIENLAPALTPDGPNPEYPWPMQQPTIAPAEHDFSIWHTLNTANGRKFLHFVSNLLRIADQFL